MQLRRCVPMTTRAARPSLGTTGDFRPGRVCASAQHGAPRSPLAPRPLGGRRPARGGRPSLCTGRRWIAARCTGRGGQRGSGRRGRRAPFARPATVRARVSGRIGPIGPRIAAVRAGGRITRLGGENWARARSSSFMPFHPELIRPSRPRSGRTGPLLSHVDHAVLVGRSAVDWERRAARFSARLRSRSPAASSGDHLGRPPTLAEHARPWKRSTGGRAISTFAGRLSRRVGGGANIGPLRSMPAAA